MRNEYLDQKDPKNIVAREVARFEILTRPGGYLLVWDSTFTSDKELYFGDQEEMGLGIRVATPLRVASKRPDNLQIGRGTIRDSQGRKNEKEIHGNSADWCDYSGMVDGQRAGVMVVPDPANFRRCWFHARDYGFVAANPFGQNAFTKGPRSRVAVKPGESLRLRYAIVVHRDAPDLPALYRATLELLEPRQ